MKSMDFKKLPSDIDAINYIAIELLENIGIQLPSEQQISFVESLLQQFKFQTIKEYLIYQEKFIWG